MPILVRRSPTARRGRGLVAAGLALIAALVAAAPGRSHVGPPFPIVMEAPAGPWLASVWTDPDVGIAVFYVILEPAPGTAPAPVEPASAEPAVRLGVAPVSGRLPEAIHPAELQPSRQGHRYYAEIPLDREELWRVTAYVAVGGTEHVLAAEVEATPDGKPGPLAALVTLVPFVALGALWLKAALLRRQHRRPDEAS
ncbi:MAG TPA: hypothetical protein VHQ65_08930 [Thermoanaerobaculia bacterium]|nr:hypothetical protein [Thermoanaerobaculia bacterium]